MMLDPLLLQLYVGQTLHEPSFLDQNATSVGYAGKEIPVSCCGQHHNCEPSRKHISSNNALVIKNKLGAKFK